MIYHGDTCEVMKKLIAEGIKVQTCVTSPPYYGLRNYQHDGQLGLEKTPEEYVAKLVEVFRLVRELLADDGTLWLNLGDSYSGSGKGGQSAEKRSKNWQPNYGNKGFIPIGLKAKDLIGIPWRVAFALQADGWYLRQDIIWHKPNPMPESVTDRPTKAHEYIFLLSKSPKYFYDYEAILEPAIYAAESGDFRPAGIVRDREYDYDSKQKQLRPFFKDAKRDYNGKHSEKQRGHSRRHAGFNDRWDQMSKLEQCSGMRNKRSVWTVTTKPYAEAHFAVYPPDLIEPCILAGSRGGDTVLDPFNGSGTTGLVAYQNQRNYIGIEINQDYINLTNKRLREIEVKML